MLSQEDPIVEVVTTKLEGELAGPIGSRGHTAGCDETLEGRRRKPHGVP